MAALSLFRGPTIALLLSALLLTVGAPRAQGAPLESEVKAAYLFNFARYVTWPEKAFASPSDPIRICVLADEVFRDTLAATIADKRVGDRRVLAESRTSSSQASDCHILFLKADRASAVADLSSHAVFVVSDSPGFAASGGTANFVLADNKVRFEINPGAVDRAGLQISSRLLRLAKIVE